MPRGILNITRPHPEKPLHMRPLLILLAHAIVFLSTTARAGTESIIGTWRRADESLVEFRPDGSVTSGPTTIGRWERLRDSPRYVLRFTGALGYHDVTTIRYHRQLDVKAPGTGKSIFLDRVDNGPTTNPDAPTEWAALEMEYTDATAALATTQERHSKAVAAAAEARQKHEIARAQGRVSGWIPIAQRYEGEAKWLEASMNTQAEKIKTLAAKLGKPGPR